MDNNTTINAQVQQVADRIKELRDIMDISVDEVASALDISNEQYMRYENAQDDIPISIIYSIANILGVDSTTLLTGDSPRMSNYTIVRNGKGINIERYKGYNFSSLAVNFIGRQMDPMIVTLKHDDTPPKLVTHLGQEFNYVLEGTVVVTLLSKEFELTAGDSIYFDAQIPHGQRAVSKTSKFLTVINENQK